MPMNAPVISIHEAGITISTCIWEHLILCYERFHGIGNVVGRDDDRDGRFLDLLRPNPTLYHSPPTQLLSPYVIVMSRHELSATTTKSVLFRSTKQHHVSHLPTLIDTQPFSHTMSTFTKSFDEKKKRKRSTCGNYRGGRFSGSSFCMDATDGAFHQLSFMTISPEVHFNLEQ